MSGKDRIEAAGALRATLSVKREFLFLDYTAIAIFGYVIVALRVRDWDTRMAMVSGDDSLLAVSLYFARPYDFVADIYIQSWSPVALSSMVNWLPALAYKFLAFPPASSFVIVTILQFVLLALAMFSLTMVMTGSREASWLAAVFTMANQPARWNLAWLGGLDWMPYANWLALPFVLYAFVALLSDRARLGLILLLVGALIHPVMGVLAGMMFVATIALGNDPRRIQKTVHASLWLVAIAAVSMIPSFIASRGDAYVSASPAEIFANVHVWPWVVEPGVSAMLYAATYAVTLTVLAWSSHPLLRAAVYVTAATVTAHVTVVILEIAPAAIVIASRSSILLVLICLPLVMLRFWTALASGDALDRIIALPALFLPSPVTMFAAALTRLGSAGAVIGAAIALLLLASHVPDWAEELNSLLFAPLFGAARGWMVEYVLGREFSWTLLLIGAGAALLIRAARPVAAVVLVVALYASAVQTAANTGSAEIGTPFLEYRDAQLWAKARTPPGTGFVLTDTIAQLSWRGLSERPVVSASGIFTAYRTARIAADYNDRLTAFYARYGAKADRDAMLKLPAAAWLAFGREFGADYLVRPAAWPKLDLPEAFRNGGFVIYALRSD